MLGTRVRSISSRHKALALCVLVALGVATLSLAAPAWGAATFAVDRTDDPDPTTAGACTSAPNDCSLRGAIVAANAAAGTDTVTVPAGTYTLTIAGSGEDTSATGDLDITSDLSIRGVGARTTRVVGRASFDDRIFEIQPNATATVTGLTITGGKAVGAVGGGVLNFGNLTLNKVTLTKNTADNGSAGIASKEDGATLNLTNSTVSRNSTGASVGGVAVERGSTATITNSTISSNHADQLVGGVAAGSGALLNILNSTIASNTSPRLGGGILTAEAGTLVLVKNTIVSANTQTNCDTAQGGGIISSQGHNISSDSSCHFKQPGDAQSTNPRIGLLADNGGPTDTRALLKGSPAIDKGTNNGCPARDQRGKARPKDGNGDGKAICEMGAYEKARARHR